MDKRRLLLLASGVAGLVMAIAPARAVGQAPLKPVALTSSVHLMAAWTVGLESSPPLVTTFESQSRNDRSAARTIAVSTLVGTGAGLLIGLVLSGASVGDEQGSVILIWTGVGAAAGVVGGVATWLLGRDR